MWKDYHSTLETTDTTTDHWNDGKRHSEKTARSGKKIPGDEAYGPFQNADGDDMVLLKSGGNRDSRPRNGVCGGSSDNHYDDRVVHSTPFHKCHSSDRRSHSAVRWGVDEIVR